MNLNLKYAPEPKNMPRFAAEIIDAAKEISGVTLDYSVASLAVVDAILAEMHADGVTTEQVGETVFGFGAYVGEVFVRHAAGKWAVDPRFGGIPVVMLPGDSVCNPIGKSFKRVDQGEEHNLPYFFQVFTTPS
jgi:hypothetical protein